MGTDRVNSKGPESNSDPPDGASAAPAKKRSFWRGLFKYWLLVLILTLATALQLAAVAYHRLHERAEPPRPSPEVALGTFHFEADKAEHGRTTRADFSLGVLLPDSADPTVHDRLADHKFRVQQDVEELLRKAHGGDFDDPTLQELKRQLVEQINQTLGSRAVSEVILTDVKLQRELPAKAPLGATAESGSPRENPAP